MHHEAVTASVMALRLRQTCLCMGSLHRRSRNRGPRAVCCRMPFWTRRIRIAGLQRVLPFETTPWRLFRWNKVCRAAIISVWNLQLFRGRYKFGTPFCHYPQRVLRHAVGCIHVGHWNRTIKSKTDPSSDFTAYLYQSCSTPWRLQSWHLALSERRVGVMLRLRLSRSFRAAGAP